VLIEATARTRPHVLTRSRSSASTSRPAGITISKNDVVIPPTRRDPRRYEGEVARSRPVRHGPDLQEERHDASSRSGTRPPTRSARRCKTSTAQPDLHDGPLGRTRIVQDRSASWPACAA
jgi:hypothetical protein